MYYNDANYDYSSNTTDLKQVYSPQEDGVFSSFWFGFIPDITVVAQTIQGTNGNDFLEGEKQLSDFMGGLEGNDTLHGNGGTDVLFGNEGDDVLRGNSGNDRIIGGSGDDILRGGTGKDVFTFNVYSDDNGTTFNSGSDVIQDFRTVEDTLQFDMHEISKEEGFELAQGLMEDGIAFDREEGEWKEGVQIKYEGIIDIFLVGVSADELTVNNFEFI